MRYFVAMMMLLVASSGALAEGVKNYERFDTQLAGSASPQELYMQTAQAGTKVATTTPDWADPWTYGGCKKDLVRTGAEAGATALGGSIGAWLRPSGGLSAAGSAAMSAGGALAGLWTAILFGDHCDFASRGFRALAGAVGVCRYEAFGKSHMSLGRLATRQGCTKV